LIRINVSPIQKYSTLTMDNNSNYFMAIIQVNLCYPVPLTENC